MKNILYDRRMFVACFSISLLAAMAFTKGMDTSMAIATVAVGLAAANSFERSKQKSSVLAE
jgi:hypothetical protein